ncbi:MAG: NAD(P)/FAD-dependent oxidoreductase [Lachnospiraceae bacterium]|nr:NAD(P)/FAD-dependent oxidoreductase [Lachnospiraceae bacterium]
MKKIAVIGGGAAGMIAAIRASELGAKVTVFEKNEKLGKKIYITGKGRCNVTNDCDAQTFFSHVTGNEKFLYSAYYSFDSWAIQKLLTEEGCPLKVERGNRVFPVSDHSSDIIRTLAKRMERLGCEIRYRTEVKSLITTEMTAESTDEKDVKKSKKNAYRYQVKGLVTADGKKHFFDAVILATGGLSYPSTGSTGDGYKFAKVLEMNVIEPRPSLVPLETKETWAHALQGLSLKNVTATLFVDGKKVFSAMGEMLFTHFGVSGPLILTASSELAKRPEAKEIKLYIDLKPALDAVQFDKRLLREFEEASNKQLKNILPAVYPVRLAETMLEITGIDGATAAHSVTKKQRELLVNTTKQLELTVTGTRDFKEAIITSGGISVKEINPSTMEAKKVKNLYCAGEVLDLDAHTGGFNLQIAWSTGFLAGDSAALSEEEYEEEKYNGNECCD